MVRDPVDLAYTQHEIEQARDRDAEWEAATRKADLLDRDVPIDAQDRMIASAQLAQTAILGQLFPSHTQADIDRALHRNKLAAAGAWIDRHYGRAK